MKKSNWIVLAIAVVISAFLLWLWFYLGFNKVDSPFDLVLSIIWWACVAAIILLITRVEKKRREQIRTVYIAPGRIFNIEAGMYEYDEMEGPVATMQHIIENLDYDFDKKEMPEESDFPVAFVVNSEKYKEENSDDPDWEGSVVHIDRQAGNTEQDFDGKQELAALL